MPVVCVLLVSACGLLMVWLDVVSRREAVTSHRLTMKHTAQDVSKLVALVKMSLVIVACLPVHGSISQQVSASMCVLWGAGVEGERGHVRQPGGGVILALLSAHACLQPAQLVGPSAGTQEASLVQAVAAPKQQA